MSRARPGELLAGVAGAVLIGSLFASWYSAGIDVGRAEVGVAQGISGWEAFSAIDVLLALAGASGIALLAVQAGIPRPALPTALSVIVTLAGVAATVLVLVRIVDQPGPDEFIAVAGGAWLGLAAAVALAAGGWWSLVDEHGRGAPQPPVESRPAPPQS